MKYLLLLFPFTVYAGGYHHEDVNNYFTVEETYVTENYVTENYISESYINDKDISKGIALAIASSHPFDFATKKWQASVNGGYYDGENALSLGIAKRFDGADALFHSSYGQNSGKQAVTVGMVWRW